jgi:Rad3-related DNA helicase
MMKSNPRSFGVPHDSWRGGQYETVEFIRDSSERVVIAEAPVGSGKSAVAGALGAFGKSRTLTRTIALQKQYAETYGFEPLYGMKNYVCHLNELFNADSCAFPEKMHDCPVSAMCQYLRRREIVKNSRRQSLSYAYYMVANWPYEPPFVSYLYCDEAHLLPGIIRDFNSVVFTPKMVRKMNIGMYPTATIKNHAIRLKKAIEWMSEVAMHFKMEWNKLQAIPKAERTQSISTRMRRLNEHIRRLSIMIDRGENSPRDIFVSWSKDEFKVVPLTARYFFTPKFTSVFHKTVLTSATIGNPDVLATELGIKNFAYRSVPSNFPPKSMPVYLLEDAPKLNYRSGESAKKKHAKLIADWAYSCLQ